MFFSERLIMLKKIAILNSGFVVALIGAIAAVSVAIFQWNATEKAKLREFEQQRKEEAYKTIIYSLNGFYPEIVSCLSESDVNRLRLSFSNQMDNCWLYCSDDVVKKTTALISAVSENADSTIQTKARNDLIYAMRKEFKPESSLTVSDYVHLNPIKPSSECNFILKNGKIEPKT
ncbi:TPA: hypothetical protein NVH33_003705 [Vibrio cholerae]|nr:hypothetical protein [Vibrio cholerae]